jgi:hypothetical protein
MLDFLNSMTTSPDQSILTKPTIGLAQLALADIPALRSR